jgi:hypothetical protein
MVSPQWLAKKGCAIRMRKDFLDRDECFDARGLKLKALSGSRSAAVAWAILFALLLAACGPVPERSRPDETVANSKSERERPDEGPMATNRPGQAHDLSADEAQGGHTLARHVGRSDGDLQERLEREPTISAASTYTDRQTAEEVVGSVLDHNRRIEQWMERGGRRPNLALDYRGDSSRPIGRCMQPGATVARPAWDAIVVLKASRDGGFYVLTTYPECPR